MSSRTSPSTRPQQRRWRPVDPSQYTSAYRGELHRAHAAPAGRAQIALGAAAFFVLLICWRWAAARAAGVAGGGTTTDVAIRGACAAVFAGVLLGADLLVRRRYGWWRFRTGVVLGALAVGAFWVVRLAIWGAVYWMGQRG